MQDVQLGQYGIPVLLTIILMMIYNYTGDKIPKRVRPLIAMGLGIILSLISIGYNQMGYTFVNIVDYTLYGLMMGASVVGLYEGQKVIRKKKPKDQNSKGQGGVI